MEYDVVALGELLIDFTGYGESDRGNLLFETNPGGAPGNVLAMLAKLGRKTAFIGKVGADMFGRVIIDALTQSGIDTTGVLIEDKANTTLAFVHNSPDGDRDFSFFRNPGADTLLRAEELPVGIIGGCGVFHFGSLSLTHQPARYATQTAVGYAKKAGAVISFDPNLRPLLWDSMQEALLQIKWGCSVCDVIKAAADELLFITGEDSLESGVSALRQQYPQIRLILLTKGRQGAELYRGDYSCSHPGYPVEAVDTTGAGDAFMGCCLSFISDCGFDSFEPGALEEMLKFANAAASLVTRKKGALLSMPDKEDINRLLMN